MKKEHPYRAKSSFNGGNLDCGNGLLLLIRKHIDPLEAGDLLEINSLESSVEEDLPAWCRLTQNELVSFIKDGETRSFLVSKGKFNSNHSNSTLNSKQELTNTAIAIKPNKHDLSFIENALIQEIPNFAVMGIGSWPRPAWLLDYLHNMLAGKISYEEFNTVADDAVRLCVAAQEDAGADVITDGEQRRDSYASFIGLKLNNCQLIPLVDLLPLVDDPEKFKKELNKLEGAESSIRHPAVFGKISRRVPLALNEARFLRKISKKPIKIALPGPYLLCRTMWMECLPCSDYSSREELALDIVSILREEIQDLIDFGVEIIQLDEPILTEVVFSKKTSGPTFMCGALSDKKSEAAELDFAASLMTKVTEGFPTKRIGLHICRGNWSTNEEQALSGPYESLMPYFARINVGTLFLEYATSRSGSFKFLSKAPEHSDLAIGLVNQKSFELEAVDELKTSLEEILSLIPHQTERKLFLVPDCGFATFADKPITPFEHATNKLKLLKQAAEDIKSKLNK